MWRRPVIRHGIFLGLWRTNWQLWHGLKQNLQISANLRFLLDQGIKHLITLSPEKRPPIHSFPDLGWTEIPIKEFEAPSVSQIKKFIDICQRCIIAQKPVGIHCRMGRGRTGVMAACYLVHFHHQSPERAMITVRMMRPGSVETYEQERAVIKYNDYLHSTDAE